MTTTCEFQKSRNQDNFSTSTKLRRHQSSHDARGCLLVVTSKLKQSPFSIVIHFNRSAASPCQCFKRPRYQESNKALGLMQNAFRSSLPGNCFTTCNKAEKFKVLLLQIVVGKCGCEWSRGIEMFGENSLVLSLWDFSIW